MRFSTFMRLPEAQLSLPYIFNFLLPTNFISPAAISLYKARLRASGLLPRLMWVITGQIYIHNYSVKDVANCCRLLQKMGILQFADND